MEIDIPIIKSRTDFTKCHYCKRKYNYTIALHEDNIYVKCPHCGYMKIDLGRLNNHPHPSFN